ncbi:MAG: MobC family replication-relaxation protein [Sedimenticola sp.]
MSLIFNPKDRESRRKEKTQFALAFLLEETFTTAENMGLVMGIKSRQGVSKALSQLENAGLVRKVDVPLLGQRCIRLYGITPHGVGMAQIDSDAWRDRPSFEPSRVYVSTLQHRIDTQKLRLQAEAAGWSNWIPGERLGKFTRGDKRPDAIAVSPTGITTAIEVERTIKSKRRYEEIISHYLQLIKGGEMGINRVVYLSPAGMSLKIRKIFQEGIESVPVRHKGITKRIHLKEEHRSRFKFLDYGDWPISK